MVQESLNILQFFSTLDKPALIFLLGFRTLVRSSSTEILIGSGFSRDWKNIGWKVVR